MANKPKIKTKELMVKKKGKRERKQQQARNVSEQRDKGYIHVIRVHDTTNLAVTTRQGNRRSRTTPHKETIRGLVKHRDYPPHSYIVNEQYNSKNNINDRKCLFSCIYYPQITISPTSLFSANVNGNCVKNHPQPWTCPLKPKKLKTFAFSQYFRPN